MSLFTPADGIMKTHVQWDDLQESAFEAFGPGAKFGPNKDVKDVGCGNGFMSRICLVSPDWETEMEGVPEKFIMKISSQLPLIECQEFDESGHFHSEEFAKNLEDDVKRFHNHEAQLYNLLKKYDVTDIPTPKVYFTKEYPEDNPLKGYIIMDYVTDGVPYHIYDNLKPESILQVQIRMKTVEERLGDGFVLSDKGIEIESIRGEHRRRELMYTWGSKRFFIESSTDFHTGSDRLQ